MIEPTATPITPSDNQQADLLTFVSPIINLPLILLAGFVKPIITHFITLRPHLSLWNMYCPWKSWQSIWRRASASPPCQARDSVTKPPVTRLRSEAPGLTKDWPRASVLLFVSNALTRAVKLSNSLPLPSSVNNGTLHLAVLSDINKHGHKGDTRHVRGAARHWHAHKQRGETNKQRGWESRRTQTQTRRGEKRARQIFL